MKFNLFVAILAITILNSCSRHHEEHTEVTKFLVTKPLKKDTTITKEYVCQIQSINHIELRALEKGYLDRVYVDEGQYIQQGQTMFTIRPVVFRAELKKAQAEANYARIELKNTKVLADKNIVSSNELALSRAKYEKAQAEVELAQAHLGFTTIRAPFSGIMDRLMVRKGSLMDEGDLLTSLSDNSKMWVYFNVSESEYLDFQTHPSNDRLANVQLRMANNALFNQVGKVETIEAEFNNESGTIPFRATFLNPDRLLRHGETGNVIMKIPMTNSMIIPQKSTFEVLDKKYVFIIDAQQKVRTKEIVVAAELEDLYIIKSGLKFNDKILLEGLRKVKDGDQISYEFIKPEKAISKLKVHAE